MDGSGKSNKNQPDVSMCSCLPQKHLYKRPSVCTTSTTFRKEQIDDENFCSAGAFDTVHHLKRHAASLQKNILSFRICNSCVCVWMWVYRCHTCAYAPLFNCCVASKSPWYALALCATHLSFAKLVHCRRRRTHTTYVQQSSRQRPTDSLNPLARARGGIWYLIQIILTF